MIGTKAPLYIACLDLFVWISRTVNGDDTPAAAAVPGRRLQHTALLLSETVSLALQFPGDRAANLLRADGLLARMRVQVQAVRELKGLTIRQAAYAVQQMSAIGRMIGGWRASVQPKTPQSPMSADPQQV